MTAKEQALPELPPIPAEVIEALADKPMLQYYAVRDAIKAYAIRYALAALASDTGERGVDWVQELVDAAQPFTVAGNTSEWRRKRLIEALAAAIPPTPGARLIGNPEGAALRAQPAGGGEWLDCGHHESLMLKSAETGLPLYCALCDARTCASDNAIDAIEWKERALAAEADIERMTDAFNRENGPTFMGEPVLPPEKMVELEEGVQVPKWLLDHTRRIELYMKANLPGPWRIGGIQSHDYATPPESGGQGEIPEAVASDEPGKWVIDFRGFHMVVSSSEAAAMWNLLRKMVMRGNFAQGGGK